MKNFILISLFTFAVLFANAQVKVLSTGLVGIGTTTTTPTDQLDIIALPNTGGNSYNGINCKVDQPSLNYGYGITSNVTNALTKAIAVQLNGTDKLQIYGNGNLWFMGSFQWSDKSLKENIDTIKGALDKVLKLQGFSYNYKSSFSNESHPKKQIGLIAQDVEIVVPEVVATNENGVKGVSYQNLVALLIEAIKEQDKKIKSMQNDIDNCCTKKNNKTADPANDQGNSTTIHELELANNTVLFQNFPNPFGDGTTIKYFIPDNIDNALIIFMDEFGNKLQEFKVTDKDWDS